MAEESLPEGDSNYIPAGAEHPVRFNSRVSGVDFFAELDRYQPKRAVPRTHKAEP